jgi:hypothetical protein
MLVASPQDDKGWSTPDEDRGWTIADADNVWFAADDERRAVRDVGRAAWDVRCGTCGVGDPESIRGVGNSQMTLLVSGRETG